MAHVSLYRRYRPDTFDKLIGQGHIVRTLVNQIKTDNISHAYLFTGTRGTGKTSVARIFAKAINCEHPINGNPCGKCPSCIELQNPVNMDIIEIDAASNSTVDEIRELREKVKYAPVIGKYKVYIIDEVHMLSTSAFNALLKTLEEPPSHVVFILATTDVHKLPATILSRCMRFDFKLLSVEELSTNLKAIFDDVGKGYSEEAVTLIATAGEGSVRDSLSIADMCLAFSEGDITYNDVLEVLGASDPNVIIGLCDAIMKCDTEAALNIVNEIAGYGKNIAMLAKDISRYIRDVLYIKYCTNSPAMLKLPSDIFNKLKAIADGADSRRLLYVVDMFNGMNTELRYSTQPRILLEAALIRATTDPVETELIQRVKTLEAKLARVAEGGIVTEKKSPDAVVARPVDAVSLWAKCRLELVNKDKYYALGVPMNNYKTVELSDGALKVSYAKRSDAVLLADKENLRVIEEKLSAISGKPYRVQIVCLEAESVENAADRFKSVFGDNLKITK